MVSISDWKKYWKLLHFVKHEAVLLVGLRSGLMVEKEYFELLEQEWMRFEL